MAFRASNATMPRVRGLQHPLHCGPVATATLSGLHRSITERGHAGDGDITFHSPFWPPPIPGHSFGGVPTTLLWHPPALCLALPFAWSRGMQSALLRDRI